LQKNNKQVKINKIYYFHGISKTLKCLFRKNDNTYKYIYILYYIRAYIAIDVLILQFCVLFIYLFIVYEDTLLVEKVLRSSTLMEVSCKKLDLVDTFERLK